MFIHRATFGVSQYIHKREAVVHNLLVTGNGDSSIVQVIEQVSLTLLVYPTFNTLFSGIEAVPKQIKNQRT